MSQPRRFRPQVEAFEALVKRRWMVWKLGLILVLLLGFGVLQWLNPPDHVTLANFEVIRKRMAENYLTLAQVEELLGRRADDKYLGGPCPVHRWHGQSCSISVTVNEQGQAFMWSYEPRPQTSFTDSIRAWLRRAISPPTTARRTPVTTATSNRR